MKARRQVVTLLVATVLFACSSEQAKDYSGTFRDAQLTVTLSGAQGRYTGEVHRGDKVFPLTAREVEGRLQGTFKSDGDQFEFTATLDDDALTLVSGNTTYALHRGGTAVNPLARSAKENETETVVGRQKGQQPARKEPREKPQQRVPHTTQTQGILRLQKVSIKDRKDMIGGEAFSFLAPVGWQTEGGLVWRVHPTMPASVSMRVYNPRGPEQLEVFPTLAYSYGGLLGPGTFFPIGSNYLGNEVMPPVRDAIQYLKKVHLPRTRGRLQPRIVGEQALPRLAAAAAQADPPPQGGPRMQFTAGKIRIAYSLNGKAVEEDLYCVLNTLWLPTGNMTIQIADKLVGMRAASGKVDDQAKLLHTIASSTRINLQWYNRYIQLVQTLTQIQMQRIRAAGDMSRIISRTHNEISDMIRQSYEQRQASQDRISKNWSQYIRGVDEYYNPIEQRNVELPSGYDNAWVNGRGEYILTDKAGFNPNVEVGGDWRSLKQQRR